MISEIKSMAYLLYESTQPKNTTNVFEMLNSLDWEIPKGEAPNQAQIANWNLELSEKSCLGRMVKAAVLAEKYFPDCNIQCAEVWEDDLRNKMVQIIHSTKVEESMLQETLLYEEPHSVLFVNGRQFEPLSKMMDYDIQHPRVEIFPLWDSVVSSWLVSKANNTNDLNEKIELLNQAEKTCPGTTLVAEVKVGALSSIGKTEEAYKLLLKTASQRKTARSLFCLWLFTSDDKYLIELNKIYTSEMMKILKKEAGL